MNTTNNRIVLTALIALVVGLGIGVGATELKSGKANASQPADSNGLSSLSASSNAPTWDPFQQIRSMQMQMDRMLGQMSSEFRSEPQFSNLAVNPGYSLTMNVEDLKNRYVVHAFLPDTKASDVNVKLDNQTLKVSVNHQQTETSGKSSHEPTRIAEWGQYEQTIQLPGPVNASQMKVEKKDHELVITLPKK